MKLLKSTLIGSIFLSAIASTSSYAATDTKIEQSSETATIIFVRDKEAPRTRALKYNVYIGDNAVGRMKVNDRKQIAVTPGNYKVWSNFYQGESIDIDVKAGNTYYIKTAMERERDNKSTSFQLIPESVAAMNPDLFQANSGS